MEKRYVVPDEMLKAASDALTRNPTDNGMYLVLEAALRWLDGEIQELQKGSNCRRGNEYENEEDGFIRACGTIRNLFLAPEPEVPEAIKDLLITPDCEKARGLVEAPEANKLILEAYKRGKESR